MSTIIRLGALLWCVARNKSQKLIFLQRKLEDDIVNLSICPLKQPSAEWSTWLSGAEANKC